MHLNLSCGCGGSLCRFIHNASFAAQLETPVGMPTPGTTPGSLYGGGLQPFWLAEQVPPHLSYLSGSLSLRLSPPLCPSWLGLSVCLCLSLSVPLAVCLSLSLSLSLSLCLSPSLPAVLTRARALSRSLSSASLRRATRRTRTPTSTSRCHFHSNTPSHDCAPPRCSFVACSLV
jgi:hypothetical protein